MVLSTSNINQIAAATIAVAAVAAGSSSLYIYFLHRRLAQSTLHVYKSCNGSDLATVAETREDGESTESAIQPICDTMPDKILTSNQYVVIYDRAWRILNRASDLPSDDNLSTALGGNTDSWTYEQKLLTTYLRRNMSAFARYLPQARIIKMMIRKSKPEAIQTFNPAFIEKLDFAAGDVVCGVYEVLRREDAVVEFGIAQPAPTTSQNQSAKKKEGAGFEGRLVIGMRPVGDLLEVYSETIMWRDTSKKGVVMPLERKIPRVLHELASWWLLDSGVDYLRGLKSDLS